MQGTSTKITAASFAGWITILMSYIALTAAWGPMWTTPPPEVLVAFTGLVAFVAGYLVPEKAVIPPPPAPSTL
jgi:hypothetical protein